MNKNGEYVYFPWGRYTLYGDRLFKGVTSIIHNSLPMPDGLKRWMCSKGYDESIKYMNDRASIGTAVHKKIEQFINGECDRDSAIDQLETNTQKRMISQFFKWIDDLKNKGSVLEFKKTEYPVISNKYSYAGTSDLFCLIDSFKWIIDFKTSTLVSFEEYIFDPKTKLFQYGKQNFFKDKFVKREYGIQLSAYKNAIIEMYPSHYNNENVRTGVLNLREDCYVFEEFNEDFKIFESCLDIYKWYISNMYDIRKILKQCDMEKYINCI